MSIIRPISDLRNHADQISEICHHQGKPVFIIKNGNADLVVMSQALFERQQSMLELYQKLEEAEQDAAAKRRGVSHPEMMRRLRARMA